MLKFLRIILWSVWGLISWISKLPLKKISLREHFYFGFRKVKSLGNPIFNKIDLKLSFFENKISNWAKSLEGPKLKDFRASILSKDHPKIRTSPNSITAIYDQLKLFILTGKWEVQIKTFPRLIGPINLFLILGYSTFYLFYKTSIQSSTFFSQSSRNIFFLFTFIAIINLIASLYLFLVVFRQIHIVWRFILILILPFVVISIFIDAASCVGLLQMDIGDFFTLFTFALASFFTIISSMLATFQWRILDSFYAIFNWIGIHTSTNDKQRNISRIAAWILFCAPNTKSNYGWKETEEINFISELSEVERSGADWRMIIFSIIALLLTLNFFSIFEPTTTEVNILISTIAEGNLLLFRTVFWILVGTSLWSLFMELWLSEYPNQIIGLASVHLQHHLYVDSNLTSATTFENFHKIISSDPKTIPSLHWALIYEKKIDEGKWFCLIEKIS